MEQTMDVCCDSNGRVSGPFRSEWAVDRNRKCIWSGILSQQNVFYHSVHEEDQVGSKGRVPV